MATQRQNKGNDDCVVPTYSNVDDIDDVDDDSDDGSDSDSDGDPVEAFEEGRDEIKKECDNISEILKAYSGNPKDPGDLRKKKELSNALLEATRAVVDTYTKLIEVYDDKNFTMEQFDELIELSCIQNHWFLSRKNAILDFVGYKCHC